ncbi:hypothetical protein MNBD_NITROSPINAE01-512 [hydrothermal vent metagenome]|uniref:CBM11 domain-containing protein n=1 Tax=hydrothermal vent metagenome TaxID=652676 RepID=A0A3B1CB12_9ZZZZ
MESKLPLFYKFAPGLVVVTLLVVAYFTVSFVEEKATEVVDESGIFTVLKDFKETAREIKRVVDLFQNSASNRGGISQREIPAQPEPKVKKPAPAKLADTPRVIADFSSENKNFAISVLNSKGASGRFSYDIESEDEGAPVSVKLTAENFGPQPGTDGYINGKIDFKPPVKTHDAQAIELKVKGTGIKSFGLTLMSKDGDSWFGWDIKESGVTGEWTTITARFTSFNLWRYDMKTRKYSRMGGWIDPELIDSVRIYLQPRHLKGDGPGVLWVGSVALR